VRDISGSATGLVLTFATLVDTRRREIYVADYSGDAIRVFALDATGDVAPLREIVGNATMLEAPIGMALDPDAGELFVRPFGSSTVLVFPQAASGNVAPVRVLTSAVPLGNNSRAVAVDPRHGELYLTRQETSGALLVFPLGASGVTAPIRTLAGDTTQLVDPGPMKLDLRHDELFVLANGSVLTFARTQSGDTPPSRSFSYDFLLGGPAGIDLDPVAGELVLSGQSSSGHILTLARTASGVAAPIRDIAGPATGLSFNAMLSIVPSPLFADGFEGESTLAWSATVP
jgi:DNA-binding beta-propeller fold protein YncE